MSPKLKAGKTAPLQVAELSRRTLIAAPFVFAAAASGGATEVFAASTKHRASAKRLTCEDRLDILDLFSRYTWAYDCGDADAYAQVFTSDGVLSDGGKLHAVGRDMIGQAVKKYIDERGTNVWQHYNANIHMVGDNQMCTVYSYWGVLQHLRTDKQFGVLGLGWYVTTCAKDNGLWFIKERVFRDDMPANLPWNHS
jgi:hypothetical protein